MKNSIKLFILTLFFVYSCSDNPVNNTVTNNPPTFQDSVIKLYSPSNDVHFYTGDTIRFSWSRSFAIRFSMISDTTSNLNFYSQSYGSGYDTSGSLVIIDTASYSFYWTIVPIYLDSNNQHVWKPEYHSEVRRYYIN